MTKKGGGKRDKDADFVALDEIRKPGASLDDLSALNAMFNWSAFDDKFAHPNDWTTLDAMFPAD